MKLLLIIILSLSFCPMSLFAEGGGQTANNVSGWTVDTLREHQREMDDLRQKFMDERQGAATAQFLAAILSVKESAALALSSAKEANQKSEGQSDKRFESVNEFRKTLSDQTATFVPRKEFEQALNGLTDKIETSTKLMTGRLDLLSTRIVESNSAKAGSNETWFVIGTVAMITFTGLGVLISIFVLVTRKRTVERMQEENYKSRRGAGR